MHGIGLDQDVRAGSTCRVPKPGGARPHRAVGLVLKERIGMPANNLLLVFERQKPPTPGGPAG
jgi:hypothetical protein